MPARIGAQDVVEDRDQVRRALAGPGAGRSDVGLAAAGGFDRLVLVLVETKGLPEVARRLRGDRAAIGELA